MFFLFIVAPFIVTLLVIGIIAFFIKKADWTNGRKKAAFVGLASFLFFPTLMPAGTISAVPTPNMALLLASVYFGEMGSIIPLYAKLWPFLLGSIFVTALVFFVISQIVFFVRKDKSA